MVWSGISKRCKTKLVIFQENEIMNSENYISKNLNQTKVGDEKDAAYEDRWDFMQDNAPPHNPEEH